MAFKDYYQYTLTELFIHGDKANKNVIAYRENVWLIGEKLSEQDANNILNKLAIRGQEFTSDSDADEQSQVAFHDLYQVINNAERSDVLVGYIRDKELYLINSVPFSLDPKSSLLVKKVVQALKLSKVSYEDDIEQETSVSIPKKKITGTIPDYAYHGTSVKYIEKILRTGIMPMEYQSNYARQGVYHSDKIFFTTRFGEAASHARTTGHITKNLPAVIEFKIPDKNLIIPDYDIDMKSGKSHYDDMSSIKSASGPVRDYQLGSKKSGSLSKEFGVYGYQGSVLPQFIRYVYIGITDDHDNVKEYKRYTPKQLKKMIDMFGDLSMLKNMNEAEVIPGFEPRNTLGTVQNVNPQEKITNRDDNTYAHVEEPTDNREGYVLIYNENKDIICSLRWDWDETFGVRVPQTMMIETRKDQQGKKLSLAAYATLVDVFGGLITDEKMTDASLKNWSKNMYPYYQGRIFIISPSMFKPWDGSIDAMREPNQHIIVLNNRSDIKRLQRKYQA